MATSKPKELVEYLAKALVDDSDQVSVDWPEGSNVLYLSVGAEERGKVIGRRGRTAHAIRTVLAAASPEGKTYSLEIID